jgi:flagellar biosynthesis/type III secretory pathway protein FliH
MAVIPFVPMPRQKTAWEPLIRSSEPPRGSGAQALTSRAKEVPPPPPKEAAPPPDPNKAALAAVRAEFEAKEKARVAEHAAAMAKLQQLQAEEQQRLEILKGLALELEGSRKKLLQQVRTGAGQMILEAARKIAGDALRNQPELVEQMVAEATEALGSKGLVLHVSPQNSEHLLETLKDTGILVETDFQMSGGLRAESPAGRLDASLETALVALSRVVEQWQDAQD